MSSFASITVHARLIESHETSGQTETLNFSGNTIRKFVDWTSTRKSKENFGMHTRTLLGVFLLTAATSPGPAQEISKERSVSAAEDARFTAMIQADTMALKGMLAEDLLYVHSSGRSETKAQFLTAVGSKTIRYLSILPAERKVTFLDSAAAVIMGRANIRVILRNQQLDFDVRYVGAYSTTGDRWRLRGWQTTRITP